MRGLPGRLVVAGLLTLCVAICAMEFSGRWDKTLRDADDEAAVIGVVLCLGAAIAVANSVLKRFVARPTSRAIVFPLGMHAPVANASDSPHRAIGSPPIVPLRI